MHARQEKAISLIDAEQRCPGKSHTVKPARVFVLTFLAMIAFASNSLLCRAALKQTTIDAATFTLDRILSGAVALWIIVTIAAVHDRRTNSPNAQRAPLQGTWLSALALCIYAAAFSFAYISLPAGTGALLLFGAVQATMIFWGFRNGERLDTIQTIGLVAALAGLILLLFPGLSAPAPVSSILMLSAGVAWGIYSLRGRGEKNPVNATAGNFIRAVPFAALISVIMAGHHRFDLLGAMYAVISGAITSGLGYVIWYSALRGLKATSAATVQLSVPVLAALGGIIFLGEPITLRLVLASLAILGGIALVVIEKNRAARLVTP
jgi:drug/metabolite transporter (DMT)-like permease